MTYVTCTGHKPRKQQNTLGTQAPELTFFLPGHVPRRDHWHSVHFQSAQVSSRNALLHGLQNKCHILQHFIESFAQFGTIYLSRLVSLLPYPAAYKQLHLQVFTLNPFQNPHLPFLILVSLKCPAPSSLAAQSCSSLKVQAKWFLLHEAPPYSTTS